MLGKKQLELALCVTIIVSCVALHFPIVYYPYGFAIEVGLSLISFANPISGILYLSAAQIIPDAPGCPVSSSQMALVGFFVWQVANGQLSDFFLVGKPLWVAVAPYLLWTVGMSLVRGHFTGEVLLFAIITGMAVAVLVKQSGYRLTTCLLMFCSGHALAMCLFWILKLHLGVPVQAFDIIAYGDSTLPNMRIGTARGNANVLGAPMAIVCIGIIGWFTTRRKQGWQATVLLMACLATAIPPILGSGSRGSMVALLLGVFFLILIRISTGWRAISRLAATLAGIYFIVVLGSTRLGLKEHIAEMLYRQESQQSSEGTILAGRTLEWSAAWDAILESPILGGGNVKLRSYQGAEDYWVSHSTYLDAGLAGGFPGMALFSWFTCIPIFLLWKRRPNSSIDILLATYICAVFCIASGSSMQVKYFWMLWGMMSACLHADPYRIQQRGHHTSRWRSTLRANPRYQ